MVKIDTTIDEVNIQIESNSQGASSNLDKLSNSILKLQNILSLGLQNLSNFNSTLMKTKEITSGLNFDVSGITNLKSSLSGFSEIEKTSNFNKILSNLKEIPEITKSLGTQELKEFKDMVKEISDALEPLAKNLSMVAAGFNNLPTKIKSSSSAIKKLKNNTKEGKQGIEKILNSFSNTAKLTAFTVLLRQAYNVLGKFINSSNEYIENFNLFQVSMGENAKKAKEFTDNFSEALGVDPSNTMRYMGVFNTLAEGFGISSDNAYVMSKNLTQLSYDMSSFLNIPINEAMQKLKSGFSGEIEPMRAVGVALDQATLQETAYTLGIKKKVSEMTRAQKSELLYYQIMTKTKTMQGDMARTILQPANALRVLKQQFTLLGRAIGNIFIPMLMAIVPYIQVVVKWLTVLANKIANFFGFEIADIDTSGLSSGLSDVSTGIDDIGDSANKTNKELDRMLAKFDDLNVITFDKDKTSGGTSGTGGTSTGGSLGIPLQEYDALKGLKKNLTDVEEKLKRILPYVESIGIIFATWKISSSILKFLHSLGLISGKQFKSALRIAAGFSLTLGGGWLIWKGIQKAIDDKGLTAESVLMLVSGGALVSAGVGLMFKNKTAFQVGLGLSLLFGAGYMIWKAIKKAIDDKGLTNESVLMLLGGTALTSVAGALMFKNKSFLKIGLGITLDLGGLWAEYNGVKKALSGNLDPDAIIDLLAGPALIAAGTLAATGSWKIALTIGGFVLAFNFGLMLGNAIMDKYGDSIDFLLKKANVDFSDGVNLKDIVGTQKALGQTFELVVRGGLKNAFSSVFGENVPNWLVKGLTSFIENTHNIIYTLGVGGIPSLISNLANFAAKQTHKYLPAILLTAVKNALQGVANAVKNIPYIGEAIANGITGATKGLDEMIKNSLVDDIDEAEKLVKPDAGISGKEIGKALTDKMENTISNAKDSLSSAVQDTTEGAVTEGTKNSEKTAENSIQTVVGAMQDGISKGNLSTSFSNLQKNGLDNSTTKNVKTAAEKAGRRNIDNIKNGIEGSSISGSLSTVSKTSLSNFISDKVTSKGNSAGKSLVGLIKSGVEASSISGGIASMAKESLSNSISDRVQSKGESTGNKLVNTIKSGINTDGNQSEVSGRIVNLLKNGMSRSTVNSDLQNKSKSIGSNTIKGITSGMNTESNSTKSGGLLASIAHIAINNIIGKFKSSLGIHSPSTKMASQAKYVILGIVKGLSDNSNLVSNSMEKITNGINFGLDSETLISDEEILNTTKRIKEGLKDIENIPIDNAININKKVQSENLVETKTDGVGDIIQASYQGVSQALRENKTKERQPVNVYIGNRKVYSGYGNYLNSENNMYGTSTIRA